MKIKRGKITHYKRFQYIYGLYSLLIALDHFESVENYIDCFCILQAIKENEKELKTTFFKNIHESDFNDLTPSMKTIQKDNAKKLIEYQNEYVTEEMRKWM